MDFIMCFYNSQRAYTAFMETLFILLVNETALCGFSYLFFCLPQSHRVANLTTLEMGTLGVQELWGRGGQSVTPIGLIQVSFRLLSGLGRGTQ